MKKRIILLLLAVVVMLLCNGGARIILAEGLTPQRHPDALYFAGTRAVVELPGGLGAEKAIGIALLSVAIPCEIVADILFLPYDTARHLHYVCHPPLNELILKNDLHTLAKRLANGDDPNFVDFRFNGLNGKRPSYPLMTAFGQKRLEAFKILLDYGAEVPLMLFRTPSSQELDFLKAALPKGITPEKLKSREGSIILSELLSRAKNWHLHEEHIFNDLFPVLSFLLDCGFPPNRVIEEYNSILEHHTALDYLLEAEPSENRDKLVALMRSHGAKTFAELDAMNPHEVLLPAIDPKECAECFKPVMNILLQAGKDEKHGGHYRFSASYPGIEGPHVVVDVPWRNSDELSFRKYVEIHHRKTPTQWELHGEPFDIPAYLRLVLTPPGVRVPSRLSADLPKKDVLLEEWHTLPTCELYIERSPNIYFSHRQRDIEQEIASILALADIPYDIHGKDDRFYFEHDPINRIGRLYYQKSLNSFPGVDAKIWREDYTLERKANAMAKKAGWIGIWRVNTFGSQACFYLSHRDLQYLDMNLDHRVPYPDEIFAVVHTRPGAIFTEDSARNKGNRGDYYWNCRVHDFPKKGSIVLYYGDEASQKTMDAVVEMAKKLMKW